MEESITPIIGFDLVKEFATPTYCKGTSIYRGRISMMGAPGC